MDRQGISVDSVWGKGTTFSFLVPFKKECFEENNGDASSEIEDDEFDLREQDSETKNKLRDFKKHDSVIYSMQLSANNLPI